MEITTSGKFLNVDQLSALLVEGESNADTIQIRLPAKHGALELDTLSYSLAGYTNKETRVEDILPKPTATTEGTVLLIWQVTEKWAAVSGTMELELVGVDSAANVKIKWNSSHPIPIRQTLGTGPMPVADIMQQYLSMAQDLTLKAAASADRAETAERSAVESAALAAKEAAKASAYSADTGIYPTEVALNTARPAGDNGDFARVVVTSTYWRWDVAGSKWVNTGIAFQGDGTYTGLPDKPMIGGVLLEAGDNSLEKLKLYGKAEIDVKNEEVDAALITLNENTKYEIGTTVLTNSKAYPFNNSDATVSLITPRDNLNYIVTTEVTATSGCVGEVEVYDKQLNGFKLRFTGSGTQATVKYYVQGGLIR